MPRHKHYKKVIEFPEAFASPRSTNSDSTSPTSPRSRDVEHIGTSTVAGASFNFVNSIVGAGIIGMPLALAHCGFWLGIGVLLFVAFLINRSVVMLIQCGNVHHKRNFEELSEFLFGSLGYFATTASMFIFAFGGMIAYLVIVGDTVPHVVTSLIGDAAPSREVLLLLFSTFLILPLCLLHDISHLAWSSLLSILSDVLLALFIAVYSFEEPAVSGSSASIASTNIFAGIGTMSFAFVCQHNSFLVYSSLSNPTLATWTIVANVSVLVALLLCLLLGVGGYVAFGEGVRGDILNNFAETGTPLVTSARTFLAVTMIATYPMEFFVCRHCLYSVYKKYKDISSNRENISDAASTATSSSHESSPFAEFNHIVVSLLLWMVSVIIAVGYGDLGVVMALTGALAASMLGYIIPSCIYFKTYANEWQEALKMWKKETFEEKLSVRLRALRPFVIPSLMLVFGACACVIGVTTVLLNL